MKFKFLTGDVNWQKYGGKFVSKKLNNGEWDYWLVLDVVNMQEATGEENQPKYNVEIQAVSPQAASAKLDQALGCMGLSDNEDKNNPIVKVEALSSYGIYAQLWNEGGNNINTLLKQARNEADIISFMFGLYMDRPGNGIGQDGWDLIAGQDVRAFFGMK